MQSKLFSLAALATLAAATGIPASECTTGPIQCCNTTGKASDPSIAKVLSLLGVVAQGVDVLVGVTCTPVTVIGAGGSGCSAHPVCCTDNSHGKPL
ncbi:hypothetical protein VNI00_019228 [Paramarasmius palmivorus]|uniref:Hydrophobin n=1 Tax=Paramarasmius palmivorus TaxID=297713 RepID=A0AAW0ARG9_9AGAR